MNTINFRKTLIELALEENDDSKIAKIIAIYYANLNTQNREGLFESLLSFYRISEDQIFDFKELSAELELNRNIINTSKYTGKDFRIKQIEFSNVRGIPSLHESNDIPYGINLSKNHDSVYNSIVLANNGTGKSSIFSALEMIYANSIGEKNLRTQNYKSLKESDYLEYLERFPVGEKPICNVETIEGNTYSLENRIFNDDLITVLNPKSHFITEFDIIENGRNTFSSNPHLDYSFHNIIAKNLGLDEFLNFINILEQIPHYRRRKENLLRDNLQKEIVNNNLLVEKRTEEIKAKTLEVESYKKGETKDKKTTNISENIKQLRNFLNKNIDITFNKNSYESTISNYEKSYQSYLSKSINNNKSHEITFLNSGKEIFHSFDDCPFCQSSKKSKEEIINEVENRLKELENIDLIEKEIRENFRLLSNILLTTVTDLRKVYDIIEKERTEFSKFINLDPLNSKASQLYLSLATHINDDKLIDLINDFSKIQFPSDVDFKRLFDLIKDNRKLFSDFFVVNSYNTYSFLDERKETIESEINKLSLNSEELSAEQRIFNLENEIKELNNSILFLKKRNEIIEPDLKNATKTVSYSDRIKSEIQNYNLKFNDRKDKIVAEAFEPMKIIIEQIINNFISSDENIKLEIKFENYKYKIDGEEYESKIIIAKIIDLKTKKEITPDLYFNTFRYKLFSLMISLSIALATRIKYRINLPLVMDDLFYASDFINKISFNEFFKDLVRLFHHYTPEMPLQFILFTHDDLIFSSALEALEEYSDIGDDLIINKTLITRMFNVTDREEIPSRFDSGKNFWNLLYQLPKKTILN